MLKGYRKEVFVCYIVTLIILVLSIIYLLFYYSKVRFKLNDDNINLEVRFETDDNLYLKNVLPISDKLGKKIENKDVEEGIQQILKFKIQNTSNKDTSYEIFLTKQASADRMINGNYIKFYLTDQNDIPFKKFSYGEIPSFGTLSSVDDMPEGKLLYSGNIFSKSTQYFILRMWVSDSYGNIGVFEDFKVNVGVREKGV